jgi:hypothetical protein
MCWTLTSTARSGWTWADLAYVDVAGMRALRGRKGQRLTIIPASDAVRRLLALLAWDTDPAIELVEVG